ncbi:hypothetical protein Vretimale_6823 [Volvox reticuliferus]|uniref:CL1 n=1 Tax=Volvox reticuliferus TaxID=1737510 RepID=A0A8J4LL16_9CHLO|nr:hypothetical protein Vretifemale_6985 [Volvox reticuliferus]GIM02113.1 hypothetical protein Vretimale_6823 [Volvox reticuliferus]
MSGMLRRRACLTRSGIVLWEHLSPKATPNFEQIGQSDRCLSGASASISSSAELGFRLAIPTRRETAAATISFGFLCYYALVTPCRGFTTATPSTRTASTARGFSSAATAAATAPTPDPATIGSSSVNVTRGNNSTTISTGSSKFLAPWPWVDPSRPQVLPISVGKKQRNPVPLPEALSRLLGALPPGDRASNNLEVFIRFRLDPRRSDHLVRGSVVLPYGTGKAMQLVVFAKGADAEIARSEGVELIGDEELISAIVSSDGAAINFDRLIATPDFMRPLARAGKVLGPKGLMPNPKMGTLTTDVAGAIRDIRRGRLDYRLSREATVRAVLGRGSMTAEQLAANVGALVASLVENRPKVLAGPAAAAGAAGPAAKGGPAGTAAAKTAGAVQQATAAPTVSMLERYFMTFILKTTHSASVHISLESLVEAATKHRPAGQSGGQQQQQQQQQQKQKG